MDDVYNIIIRAGNGLWLPLLDLVEIDQGRAYAKIHRHEGRRVTTVTANVEPNDQAALVINALDCSVMPQLQTEFPGLAISYDGGQVDEREEFTSLGLTFLLACFTCFWRCL
ncbi:hypothetical protein MO867_15640 [Microbulbifer sp. OS29]|uniref:Uncharacterized protein n=1 Tax=Microbulbifer okhotskensis TaxID=2926617 RepID=A0A9X2EQ55_9GAMM|nr:hypothetical protein [Microbulbifer okhotskensis]MCO1335769.1 hypothetical protein [Microbulbifer okhotskensis]